MVKAQSRENWDLRSQLATVLRERDDLEATVERVRQLATTLERSADHAAALDHTANGHRMYYQGECEAYASAARSLASALNPAPSNQEGAAQVAVEDQFRKARELSRMLHDEDEPTKGEP